ncbi:vesicle-associated protein 1-2 [Acrasis kona]|uniref:Vesicle-associated protein 1-2 n=1 Tax=Acrasis kona TaxID=1008807 RepID=A0AAW2Z8P8_9EUKA
MLEAERRDYSKPNIFAFCQKFEEREKTKEEIKAILGSERVYQDGYTVFAVDINNRAHLIDGINLFTKGHGLSRLPAIFVGDLYLKQGLEELKDLKNTGLLNYRLTQSMKDKKVLDLYKRRADVFTVEPNGLYFPSKVLDSNNTTGEKKVQSQITITSTHLGGSIAFKVKTTHPNYYGVRPLYGVLRCRESEVINVERVVNECDNKREKFRIECLLYKTIDVDRAEVQNLFKRADGKSIRNQAIEVYFSEPPGADQTCEDFRRKLLQSCFCDYFSEDQSLKQLHTFIDCNIITIEDENKL